MHAKYLVKGGFKMKCEICGNEKDVAKVMINDKEMQIV